MTGFPQHDCLPDFRRGFRDRNATWIRMNKAGSSMLSRLETACCLR